ncbi:WG repeat-containing protein [uncultured Microscilla sp.]|uniref:WG repeat-containing protein n=1 Tax=uncultured Microscilla sp. TaxID=432653 RepID=UPI002618DB4D|nr:WG repeat-containing protein [uncultured Microscilla sp.]
MDRTGKLIVPYHNRVGNFSEGLVWVHNHYTSKYGFMNRTGKLVVQYIYTQVKNFSEGLAAVKKNGKWGFIDTTGKLIIDNQFESANSFSEGLAIVEKDNKYGVIINPLKK